MKSSTIWILILVAIASILGATNALLQQPGYSAVNVANTPAFPELRAGPDQVAQLEIIGGGGHFSLERQDAGWVSLDAKGFPADDQKIAKLVVGLSDMQLVSAKTRQAELYHRLDLADPEVDPDSRAQRLVLRDNAGETLVDATFGKKHWRRTGNARTGIYLRRSGEAQSWLASGGEAVEGSLVAWLDKVIVDIPPDRLARVAIRPAAFPAYEILRDSPEEIFLLPALPVGRAVDGSQLRRISGSLAGLTFTDLKAIAELPADDGADSAVFETFDGLEVRLQRRLGGDDDWITFEARATTADAALAEEVEAINRRLKPWAFKLNKRISDRLGTAMEDLLDPAGS